MKQIKLDSSGSGRVLSLFPLADNFFSLPTIKLAKKLLGIYLVHSTSEGKTVGRIVETEAYLFRNDPACHSHRGMTKRNKVMFGPSGFSYVYLIYGMYYCFNVVTGKEGEGEAVLIRALEPISGIGIMQKRRNSKQFNNLCSGPGKLTSAMGLTIKHNSLDLRTSCLQLLTDNKMMRVKSDNIIRTPRIGISTGKELLYRFYLKNNQHVSGAKKYA